MRRRTPFFHRQQEQTYNSLAQSYNDRVAATNHVMKLSRNGQVSIPAAVRARWGTRTVIVVDLGDRVVMRPGVDSDGATAQLQGKYAGRGPDTSAARRTARRAADSADRRRG